MNPYYNQSIFLSYRGGNIAEARIIKDWLLNQAGAAKVHFFEPNELCAPNEILMPYEYIELLDNILTPMFRSSMFMYLNHEGYWDSFFTQMEVLQWRRRHDAPIAYPIAFDGSQILTYAPETWQVMDKNEKKLWASLSVGIGQFYKHHRNPGFSGGKFNRSTYLIPCPFCGSYFLISTKLADQVKNGTMLMSCPFCKRNVSLAELPYLGKYHRRPIVLTGKPITPRLLQAAELLDILFNNKTPASIPLVAIGNEVFLPDWQKATLGTLVGLGLVALVIGLFAQDED